nr:hypothetical protein [uncultured Enterobacter sp.]
MDYLIDFLQFLFAHPLATFCGVSAFVVSCWSGYTEHETPGNILISSLVCVVSSLAFLAILFQGNHYHLFLPLVGIVTGFIGPFKIKQLFHTLLRRYFPQHFPKK